MFNRKHLALVLAGLIALSCVSCRRADTPPFSADFSIIDAVGTKSVGKLYFSWPYVRTESAEGILINDFHSRQMLFVRPAERTYMNWPIRANDFHRGDPCSTPGLKCRKLGTDTVNGRACTRVEITADRGRPRIACVDRELHFPIQMRQPNGAVITYSNVKPGPQPESMFEVPTGYRQIANPWAK